MTKEALDAVQRFIEYCDQLDTTSKKLERLERPDWEELDLTIRRLRKLKDRVEAELRPVLPLLKTHCGYNEAPQEVRAKWDRLEERSPLSNMTRLLLKLAAEEMSISTFVKKLSPTEDPDLPESVFDLGRHLFGSN